MKRIIYSLLLTSFLVSQSEASDQSDDGITRNITKIFKANDKPVNLLIKAGFARLNDPNADILKITTFHARGASMHGTEITDLSACISIIPTVEKVNLGLIYENDHTGLQAILMQSQNKQKYFKLTFFSIAQNEPELMSWAYTYLSQLNKRLSSKKIKQYIITQFNSINT